MSDVDRRQSDIEEITEQWVALFKSLGEEFLRLGPHAWRELAGTGRPIDPARLAALTGMPLDKTVSVLRESGAEWDPSGTRVVGAGVSLLRTPHQCEMDGRTVWTWCAPDLLVLPIVLGKPARIQSPCAATGDPVRVQVTPTRVEHVEPASAVTSLVPTHRGLCGVRQMACNEQNFYRDAEAASGWLASKPDGRLLPVADAFEVFRRTVPRVFTAELRVELDANLRAQHVTEALPGGSQ